MNLSIQTWDLVVHDFDVSLDPKTFGKSKKPALVDLRPNMVAEDHRVADCAPPACRMNSSG